MTIPIGYIIGIAGCIGFAIGFISGVYAASCG